MSLGINDPTRNCFSYKEDISFISHAYGCKDPEKLAEYFKILVQNKWWKSTIDI